MSNTKTPSDLADTAIEKLDSIMEFVSASASKTTDFVVEQTPLFIQELLAWNFTLSLIWFIFGVMFILLIGVAIWVGKKIYKNVSYSADKDAAVFGTGVICCVLFGLGMGFISNKLDWIKIKVAPRVWLVEYTSNLVKGK